MPRAAGNVIVGADTRSLEDRKTDKVAEIEAAFAAWLAAGCPYEGEHVQVDDASRANLTALGTTAIAVIGGALPTWPEDYARGWIAMSRARIPLDSPQVGLQLAAAAGAFYAAGVQHEADLIAAALGAADQAALEQIDTSAGWPTD